MASEKEGGKETTRQDAKYGDGRAEAEGVRTSFKKKQREQRQTCKKLSSEKKRMVAENSAGLLYSWSKFISKKIDVACPRELVRIGPL